MYNPRLQVGRPNAAAVDETGGVTVKARTPLIVESPVGRREADSTGSPVGVARLDVDRSYAGVAELLQEFINQSNPEAWARITAKIDYTYAGLDRSLTPLEVETDFAREVEGRLAKRQKLLFKPNLVSLSNIDPETHGPGMGNTTCTDWVFVAALMRWFHDELGVSYHQMALGEAATSMPAMAGMLSRLNSEGGVVTTEAAIEGKIGDFYGGWGFYFVRKYLAETLAPGAIDDPMKGYQESLAGSHIPPGETSDKLLVYDLNRIFDDPTKGRELEVPGGINFESIILHKAIVGGDPDDPEDLKAYPGCILINVPKLKVHNFTLFTNVIKNLGIGLYPMQTARAGGCKWDYSVPHTPVPGMKGNIPHQIWDPELDPETGYPRRNRAGVYQVRKTGGITATMIDIIKAVADQGIYMIHVSDAIEAINTEHTGRGVRQAEGMVFAGLDPVATDLASARYMFSNVPIAEAEAAGRDLPPGERFPQAVPVPSVEAGNIVTRADYDYPLSRDVCFENAEKRGLGGRDYFAVGWDEVTDRPLVSVQGHLGTVSDGRFCDLVTETLYFDLYKIPWDLQKTTFGYLDAVDELTGSSLKREFLDAFDEDGDGVVSYEEFGTKGLTGSVLYWAGSAYSKLATEEYGYLRAGFGLITSMLKAGDASWNSDGHDLFKEYSYGLLCLAAYQMSQLEMELPDPFCPGMTCGKGKWPSLQLARFAYLGIALYGEGFPTEIAFPSLYGSAFQYADLVQNDGRHVGDIRSQPDPEGLRRYLSSVAKGEGAPLDFTVYVPAGFDNMGGASVPNVQVADDPGRIFTASFSAGQEIWSGAV